MEETPFNHVEPWVLMLNRLSTKDLFGKCLSRLPGLANISEFVNPGLSVPKTELTSFLSSNQVNRLSELHWQQFLYDSSSPATNFHVYSVTFLQTLKCQLNIGFLFFAPYMGKMEIM